MKANSIQAETWIVNFIAWLFGQYNVCFRRRYNPPG